MRRRYIKKYLWKLKKQNKGRTPEKKLFCHGKNHKTQNFLMKMKKFNHKPKNQRKQTCWGREEEREEGSDRDKRKKRKEKKEWKRNFMRGRKRRETKM